MPDILIRISNSVQCCGECPCFYAEHPMHCQAIPKRTYGAPYAGKPDWCPLHELPPHGDLIDLSKVVLEYGGLAKIPPHDFVSTAQYFAEQLEGQPVIVPASEPTKSG